MNRQIQRSVVERAHSQSYTQTRHAAPDFFACQASWKRHQDNDRRQDHEVGVEQDEHAGMVKTPPPLQAASRLCHAPGGDEQGKNQPPRTVEILNVGKSSEPQAGRECAQ